MTLAAILLVSTLGTVLPWITSSYYSTPLAASASQSSNAAKTQSQDSSPSAQAPNTSQSPSAAPPAKTAPGANAPLAPKRHKKKAPASSNCSPTAVTGAAASTSPNPAPANAAPATTSTSTNCPPSKVIVKQGGTAEPSIQLAGGAGSKQTSQEADTAKQMLGTTEANLKQIAGKQLNSAEQDMVNQIRQFMAQSKAAAGDGDLDRARTLAWKAQVLSQELVKPSQ